MSLVLNAENGDSTDRVVVGSSFVFQGVYGISLACFSSLLAERSRAAIFVYSRIMLNYAEVQYSLSTLVHVYLYNSCPLAPYRIST